MSFYSEIVTFFQTDIVTANLQKLFYFRVLFGSSLLLKHIIELLRRYPKHINKSSFQYHSQIGNNLVRKIGQKIYFNFFHFRLIFVLGLIYGLDIKICSFFLLVSYTGELFCLFRYHTIIAVATLIFVVLDPAYTKTETVWCYFYQTETDPPILLAVNCVSLIFIKFLVVTVYLSSALRKIQHDFHDGFILKEGTRFSLEAEGRKYPDHFGKFTLFISRNIISKYPKFLSQGVIFLEIVVPFLLIFGSSPILYLGFFLGIVLHLGMMMLFPVTLSFFSLMMISLLMLWI